MVDAPENGTPQTEEVRSRRWATNSGESFGNPCKEPLAAGCRRDVSLAQAPGAPWKVTSTAEGSYAWSVGLLARISKGLVYCSPRAEQSTNSFAGIKVGCRGDTSLQPSLRMGCLGSPTGMRAGSSASGRSGTDRRPRFPAVAYRSASDLA